MIMAIAAFLPVAVLVLRFHWLGLPGVWAALGLWLTTRSVLLGRRWAAHVRCAAAVPVDVDAPGPESAGAA
jgi:Na+-driven multidrug efflux pump